MNRSNLQSFFDKIDEFFNNFQVRFIFKNPYLLLFSLLVQGHMVFGQNSVYQVNESVLGRSPLQFNRQGPVPPIESGFGSWGNIAMAPVEDFQWTTSQGYTNTVTLYHPVIQSDPAPTIFFAPGWNIANESYEVLFRFLVSKGYVVVCVDYVEDTSDIGTQLAESFSQAASRYPDRIETLHFGLAGHSSGGGLLASVGYELVRNQGWGGTDGQNVFLYFSAPWIDWDMTDAMIADYPSGIKCLLQTYQDDDGTDLRTYIDQFESLTSILDSEKDYITLRPCVIGGYSYQAVHNVLATGGDSYGVYDAMDDYGVFRLIDALAKYTFTGDPAAKKVALGNGEELQIELGELPDLISIDDPRPIPGETYPYPCDVAGNPRKTHCDDYDGELPAPVLLAPVKHVALTENQPVFQWESSPTATDYFIQIRPMLPSGEPDWTVSYGENLTSVEAGCDGGNDCGYTISSSLPEGAYVWWILPGNDTTGGAWSRRGYFSEDYEAPAVQSIDRLTPNPTVDEFVSFVVTFTEPVSGVDSSDFRFHTTGSLSGPVVNMVFGSGDEYIIKVHRGAGTGTLRLDIQDDDTIVDIAGTPLGGSGLSNGDYHDGEEYVIIIESPLFKDDFESGNTVFWQ